MDNIIKQLKNGAKHTRLSFSEKSEMKNVLLQHVRIHPVRGREGSQRASTSNGDNPANTSVFQKKSIPSPFSIQSFRNTKTLPILVIVGLLMGGSVSFAAEQTVPGDVLFPVKVHVNERARGAVAITPKAKAEWDVRLVERRLLEVEKLAADTSAPSETKAIAEKNFKDYSERVKNRISKFEKDDDSHDAIETAGKFSEMLRKHEGKFEKSDDPASRILKEENLIVQNSTTTVDASDPALLAPMSFDEDEQLKEVHEKVREMRNETEKKQKELKEKYRKEEVQNIVIETLQSKEVKRALKENTRREEIRSIFEKNTENNSKKSDKTDDN
ncbi:MAG: hypothetical protein Q7K40_04030 [bacterium]|nr:hypothetical protein [bacterium]